MKSFLEATFFEAFSFFWQAGENPDKISSPHQKMYLL